LIEIDDREGGRYVERLKAYSIKKTKEYKSREED
jgi:hypothetical protein